VEGRDQAVLIEGRPETAAQDFPHHVEPASSWRRQVFGRSQGREDRLGNTVIPALGGACGQDPFGVRIGWCKFSPEGCRRPVDGRAIAFVDRVKAGLSGKRSVPERHLNGPGSKHLLHMMAGPEADLFQGELE